MTEKRKAEQRLEDLQAELVHLSRWNMMGMMAATIAHELNQPLAAIANYAAALKRMLAAPNVPAAASVDILEKIGRQRERAGQIVQRLRNQVARGDAERRPEALDAVVAEALELAASTTQRGNVHVSLEAVPGLPPVLVDRVQIQQVVVNLVRNAVEAMENSQVRRLAVELARDENGIRVGVADTGAGIAGTVAEKALPAFRHHQKHRHGSGTFDLQGHHRASRRQAVGEPNAPRGTVFAFSLPAQDVDSKT